jgi:lipoic acid synthetase
MAELVTLGIPSSGEKARRPSWLKVKVQDTNTYRDVRSLLHGLNLNTVCEDARCPNIWECWGQHRTATMMILGDVCTRNCRYCSVTSGKPPSLPDPQEPQNVAEAVVRLGLRHAVITSVDRDDLPDYGSGHFAETLEAIRKRSPDCRLEVLIPDFMGHKPSLEKLLDARPDVMGHNTETVPRLYKKMRSKGVYETTLQVIQWTHEYRLKHGCAMTTKTGIMVGLGETIDELLAVMDDLRSVHCDVLTLGQYLNPTKKHAQVARFYTPEEFDYLKEEALKKGFLHVESGPLVRSSYHAHEHVPTVSAT